MNSRNVTLTLLLILLLSGIFLCRRWQEPVRKEALDRRPGQLIYSAKATCLMTCQQMKEEEIERVIKKGVILFHKSSRFSQPCPTFAVQGALADGRSVQVTLQQCASETMVLSCYFVNEDFKCECPEDGRKVN